MIFTENTLRTIGNRNSMEIDFLLSNESPVNFKKRVGESSEVLPRLIKSPYKTKREKVDHITILIMIHKREPEP